MTSGGAEKVFHSKCLLFTSVGCCSLCHGSLRNSSRGLRTRPGGGSCTCRGERSGARPTGAEGRALVGSFHALAPSGPDSETVSHKEETLVWESHLVCLSGRGMGDHLWSREPCVTVSLPRKGSDQIIHGDGFQRHGSEKSSLVSA